MANQIHETTLNMTCGVEVDVRAEYAVIDGEVDELYIYQASTDECLSLCKSDEDQVRDAIMQAIH